LTTVKDAEQECGVTATHMSTSAVVTGFQTFVTMHLVTQLKHLTCAINSDAV